MTLSPKNSFTGDALIKDSIKDIPNSAGVYFMLNEFKQIIYIGKAKDLKKRLASYAKPDLIGKTARMILQTHYLEYTITTSEVDALLLESQLIKKNQPKFNILLKDDKSFPYIKLRLEHDYPQIIKYRGKVSKDNNLFGPFASVNQVDTTLNELQKIFKLRPCSDNYFASRKRPCLQYQIGRCYAPCVGKISKEDYADLVNQALAFLSGKNHDLQQILSKKMESLSENLNFEEAAKIRDRIRAISYVQLKSGLVKVGIIDADVISIAKKNDTYCIEVFLYRAAQNCGNKAYFPVHTEEATIEEVLESFISQFYQTRIPPKEIIIEHDLEQPELIINSLKQLHGITVKITKPNRGEKLTLLANAQENAKLALEQEFKKNTKNQLVFEALKKMFNLTELERIEVYDNSHIMGNFAVGGMIVASPNGFEKKEYRIFNIALSSKGDDYNMLKEVLTRRFARLATEPHKVPSLMIIDGGKGHLSVVKKVMKEFDLNLPFTCMSKGLDRNAGCEQFHTINDESFTLEKNDNVMKYLQILRDEAHNFAIKNHRLKRSRAIKISSLDDIPTIGELRKKALLNYFGDFKTIKEASIDELSKVQGINKSLAKTIHSSLKLLSVS